MQMDLSRCSAVMEKRQVKRTDLSDEQWQKLTDEVLPLIKRMAAKYSKFEEEEKPGERHRANKLFSKRAREALELVKNVCRNNPGGKCQPPQCEVEEALTTLHHGQLCLEGHLRV